MIDGIERKLVRLKGPLELTRRPVEALTLHFVDGGATKFKMATRSPTPKIETVTEMHIAALSTESVNEHKR